jgi:pyruvate ferredoxin oxidoreductase alpha subunit
MTIKYKALTGNEASAYAMKQVKPDVVAAYPITPQTSLMQKFADYVADGEVDTEMILVESEHSAMSACVGSAAAGARTMTATSANGLALMWEIVYIAASSRLPIVMPVVNRALSGPINIHCDHSDTMGCRDSGWIQLYSENAQEVYDNMIQAVRIAENPKVLLPVMVMYDGFIISHGMENVEVYPDSEVYKFVGAYNPEHYLLDVKNPYTFGPIDLTDYYFEHKKQQAHAMSLASGAIMEVAQEFNEKFGRLYSLIEAYKVHDAELAIVAIGSTCGTAKVVVDELRAKGVKAGLLKIRTFRPFPEDDIAVALLKCKAVAVLDRAEGFSATGGPLYREVKAGLLGREKVLVSNYIYGLGGRDIGLDDIRLVYKDLAKIAQTGKMKPPIKYLGVRE